MTPGRSGSAHAVEDPAGGPMVQADRPGESDAIARARDVVAGARAAGRSALFEHEGYAVLEAFGLPCPRHVFAAATGPVSRAALDALPGSQLVVKAVTPGLLHKSTSGGVVIVPRADVCGAAADLRDRLGPLGLAGILVAEFVPHERGLGHELLIAAQHTREFGPLITVSPGGAGAELIASCLAVSARVGVVHGSWPTERLRTTLDSSAIVRLATADPRAGGAGMPWSVLEPVLRGMLRLALALGELGLHELEVNPFVASVDRLIAVDALATLGEPDRSTPPRPLEKMHHLLRPRRVAIAGVSEHMNPGHVILHNLLRDGFSRESITIVKPGASGIEGCAAVPSVAALDPPVDLLVLAVPAVQAASMLLDAAVGARAESVVLIPGGFEEKDGCEGLAASIRGALDRARMSPSRGPLVLGGNCLGFRSRPGRCDTLFIPDHKLPSPSAVPHPLAVVAQSGAFAISRADCWHQLVPKYVLTTGNQIDLTLGDCLSWLQDDRDIHVFALYVEGFKPLDGWRTLTAIDGIVRSGRTVVVYRAGRTVAGARASASHTASIAGDYLVTRALFEQAGACVADDVGSLEDIVYLATLLDGRRPAGGRVAAVSNAGFECVAMADWTGSLRLPAFALETESALHATLSARRIDAIVDVHNPLDLTPMADAAAYETAIRAVLGDPAVDLAIAGCIPLTPTLDTLPRGHGHTEDLARPEALPARLGRIRTEVDKPFVVVVDAGARYDAFAAAIERHGIPVFRTADRAMRAMGAWLGTNAR